MYNQTTLTNKKLSGRLICHEAISKPFCTLHMEVREEGGGDLMGIWAERIIISIWKFDLIVSVAAFILIMTKCVINLVNVFIFQALEKFALIWSIFLTQSSALYINLTPFMMVLPFPPHSFVFAWIIQST